MATTPPAVFSAGRRTFLRWATAAGGIISALLAGVPAARAFLSPTFRRQRGEKWIRLGDVDQFDPGVPTKVDFVDTVNDAWVEARRLRSVWIYTEDGERFTVYNGRCTHLGCNYSLDQEKKVFRCPCHTGFFNIKTGAVLAQFYYFRLGVPEKAAV